MPRPIVFGIVILVVLSWVPLALIAKARASKSTQPRVHLVPDMDNQPRFRAQSANPLFADGRAMRQPVGGTVAVGDALDDGPWNTGKIGEEWVRSLPMPITPVLMRRGQERFDIFCASCHGLSGYGDGMTSARAMALMEKEQAIWTPPTSLHSEAIGERTDGELFHTITYGVRTMPAYGTQIPLADRWAIVAYVRALQRSRNATIEDVPEAYRPTLK